jgi:hypothetical protein
MGIMRKKHTCSVTPMPYWIERDNTIIKTQTTIVIGSIFVVSYFVSVSVRWEAWECMFACVRHTIVYHLKYKVHESKNYILVITQPFVNQ